MIIDNWKGQEAAHIALTVAVGSHYIVFYDCKASQRRFKRTCNAAGFGVFLSLRPYRLDIRNTMDEDDC